MNQEIKWGSIFVAGSTVAGYLIANSLVEGSSAGNKATPTAVTRSIDDPSLARDIASADDDVDTDGEGMVYGKASYINYFDGVSARNVDEMVSRIRRNDSLQRASMLHRDIRIDPDSVEMGLLEPVHGKDLPNIGAKFGPAGIELVNQMKPGIMTFRKNDGTVGTINARFVDGPTNEARGEFSLDELFWVVKALPLEDKVAEIGNSKYGLLYPLERALYQSQKTKEKIAEAIRVLCDQNKKKGTAPTQPTKTPTEVPATDTPTKTPTNTPKPSTNGGGSGPGPAAVPTSTPKEVPLPTGVPTNIGALPTETVGPTEQPASTRTPEGTLFVPVPTGGPTNVGAVTEKTVGPTTQPASTRTSVPGPTIAPTALGTSRPNPTPGPTRPAATPIPPTPIRAS